ncbi:hypothetical protein Lser_V15G40251 [Lactuca serriola]
MARFHHPGDPYFPNHGNNGWLEELEEEPGEDPVMGQEARPGVEPEEYMETYYEFGESDEIMEEEGNTDEVSSEPPTPETVQEHIAIPQNHIDRTHALEEEVATLRQQLLATEAQVVRAEQERDEITREITEMANFMAQHFDI